jgi:hypothetical protein
MLQRFDGSEAFIQGLGDLPGAQAGPEPKDQDTSLLLR